jgi:putative glutathione S-transferase
MEHGGPQKEGNTVAPKSQYPKETVATGEFQRQESRFRRRVDGGGSSPFPPVPGRYHLYVSYACPWAHRTIIVRNLKKLQEVISLSVVDPIRDEAGWAFREGEGHGPDPVNSFAYLSEAYTAADPEFEGRVTVPVLWDRESGTIVNNESSEIIRMLNGAFTDYGDGSVDLYPQELRDEIDRVNELVYHTVNNGVYKAGFATSQPAYEEACLSLFETLDRLEEGLGNQRYLVGNRLTEADIRLFTTLVRFDPVYHGHFKCNIRQLKDYPNLWGYTRDLYNHPGIGETVNMDHIKRHYYATHTAINPTGIVPLGPDLVFSPCPERTYLG